MHVCLHQLHEASGNKRSSTGERTTEALHKGNTIKSTLCDGWMALVGVHMPVAGPLQLVALLYAPCS